MHILEEWAKKSQRKRKRTDDTPGPTPKKPTTSGPPGQLGPSVQPGSSRQPEHLTPDSSNRTAALDPTPTADPTPVADPTAMADPTPGVRPPVIASPPVRPLLVRPLLVRPPPVADTLGGLFGGGLQGLDDHNPQAKWVAQSWPIWHHCAIYVANCVRYRNDDEHSIRIMDFRWSYGTIRGPKLQDVWRYGQPGVRFIGLVYKSGGLLQSLPWERMVFIERDEYISTWLKLTCHKDIPNSVLLVLPQDAPDADGGRLLASVWWVLCWLQLTAFTRLMNLVWLVVQTGILNSFMCLWDSDYWMVFGGL